MVKGNADIVWNIDFNIEDQVYMAIPVPIFYFIY